MRNVVVDPRDRLKWNINYSRFRFKLFGALVLVGKVKNIECIDYMHGSFGSYICTNTLPYSDEILQKWWYCEVCVELTY